MKKRLARISIIQSSKILTALYALMGCLYSLIGIPMVIFGNGQMKIIGVVYLFGPVWMAAVGFVFFAIFAAIYNALAKVLGGFEFEVETVA
jgi:hypothetical protein